MRSLSAALALLIGLCSAAFAGGPKYPPPPQVTPDCSAGQSVTGYPFAGAPIGSGGHCGNGVATGVINSSTVGTLGELSGTTTITGIVPGGDVSFTSPNFTVTGINGVALGSTTATSGHVLVGSGTQWASVAVGGDLSAVANGTFTIGSGAVTSGKMAAGAAQGNIANGSLTNAQLANSTIALGSTTLTLGGTTTSVSGLTLSSPTLTTPAFSGTATGSFSFGGAVTFSGGAALATLTNAPLLGTDLAGNLRAITLGSNLSLSGTTLNASGSGGGGNVTWPASNSLIISNQTNSPSGLAPINNDLLVGAGSSWTPLTSANSSVLVTNGSGVPSLSTMLPSGLTIPGYLTGNQTITIGGDASGSGATSITVTNNKLNGVTYPATPASNTIPYISASNTASYGSASTILSLLGIPFSVPDGGTGLGTLTSGAIYMGNGTGNILPSALSDNGTIVSTSEPFDLTSKSQTIEIANASSGGTSNGLLAKLTGAPSTALTVLTSDTDGAVGVVVSGGGTTGKALIAIAGQGTCTFDGSTTAGDYVVISGTTAGNCHDTGSTTRPNGAQVIGRTSTTNTGSGSYALIFNPAYSVSGSVTWPANHSLVVSNTTNSPTGIAEIDGDCVVGSGGVWTAGSCTGTGGGVTSSGTVTSGNIPTWSGTYTLNAAGVPYGTTGNSTLAETLGTGLLNNAIINWAAPSAIGGTTPAGGAFTTLSASSTVSGTGFSTYLASPPAIGGTTAAAGNFSTLSASNTVSGTGFSTYLASPPAIGGTVAAAGSFTTLSASSTVSGSGFSTYLASPPAIGGTAAAAGSFTTLSATGNLTTNITGSTQCVHVNSSGVASGTGADCGTGTAIDTVTTGIAAAGTTLAGATSLTTQQNYVATGANCTTYNPAASQSGCAGQAAVKVASALMVAGQHVYITNEDPADAVLVYPDTTGHTINNQAAGLGIAVQANQTMLLIVKSSTALRTVP